MQDTFVIAFKKPRDLRGETLLAYLKKIAIHECFRKRKAQRQQQSFVLFSLDDEAAELPDANEDFLPEASLYNKERQGELMQIINSLSKNQREMTYLYYYFNFNTEEIARLYNCSGGIVRVNLQRARQAIKNKLEGNDRFMAKKMTATAVVALGALFVLEEQVFAASYVLAGASTAAATTAATTVTVASVVKGCVVAACLVAVGITAAVLYSEPVAVEANDPRTYITTTAPSAEVSPLPASVSAVELHMEAPPTSPASTDPPQPLPTDPPLLPTQPPTTDLPPLPTQPTATAPPPLPTSPPTTTSPPLPTPPPATDILPPPPTSPPPTDPPAPTEPPLPEPPPANNAQDILARLETATSAQALAYILDQYGFFFAATIQNILDMNYRFYTLRTDCGDILVGTVVHEGGTDWRMRFALFEDNDMPTDMMMRVRFMNDHI